MFLDGGIQHEPGKSVVFQIYGYQEIGQSQSCWIAATRSRVSSLDLTFPHTVHFPWIMGSNPMTSGILYISMTPESTCPAKISPKFQTGRDVNLPAINLQLDILWAPAIQLNLFSSSISYPMSHLTPSCIPTGFSSVFEVSMKFHFIIHRVTPSPPQ